MNNVEEEWRDIEGYVGIYQVSNLGRIRGIDRTVKTKRGKEVFVKGVVISHQSKNNGYLFVELNKNGRGKNYPIHRIVAKAFIPNPENKPYVNHIDYDRTNAKAYNLEWCTPKENVHHSRHRMYNPVTGKYGGEHPHSIDTEVFEVCIRKIADVGSIIEAIELTNVGHRRAIITTKNKRTRIKDYVFLEKGTTQTNIGDVVAWTDVLKSINKQ